MHDTVESLYNAVAQDYAGELHKIFANEETLQEAHKKYVHAEGDRTNGKWNVVFSSMLREAWVRAIVVHSTPTGSEASEILKRLAALLDYNLCSQVYLNMQQWQGVRYAAADAVYDQQELLKKWSGKSPNPFEPKAKMYKIAASPAEVEYNRDLSQIKALRTISLFDGDSLRFRVSPIGTTPALADSNNLSTLGIGGDRYLRVPDGLNVYYVCWEQAPPMASPSLAGTANTFVAEGIPYTFESKSGGDILNQVLYARYLMMRAVEHFSPWGYLLVLPRMTSLMIVTSNEKSRLGDFVSQLPGNPQLFTGSR